MGATFVITLREAFEAALLLGIVYTYLDKLGARDQYRYVTLGGLLGAAASVLAGIAISIFSGPLLDFGPDLLGTVVLFGAGVGKLEGFGLLPASPTLWDTSHLLSDRGILGGFLGGLAGYRARPSLLEVIAYASYLLVAATLFFGVTGAAADRPRPARE